MPPRLPFVHIVHLITELRRTAGDNMAQALADSEGGLDLCLAAALMQDAADALEDVLTERTANDEKGHDMTTRANRRQPDNKQGSCHSSFSGSSDSIRVASDHDADRIIKNT